MFTCLKSKTQVTSQLVCTQKRFRGKILRGYLAWNKWDPKTFRRAIYKYVDGNEYKKLRNPDWIQANPQVSYDDLKNIEYSIEEIQKTNPNKPNINEYKELNYNYNGFKTPTPYPKGLSSYKLSQKHNNIMQYNIYKFKENESDGVKEYQNFQPDLWMHYAYRK